MKKRKRDLRGKKREAEVTTGTSCSTSSSRHPNDRLSAGLAVTVSNLLGKCGVFPDQFDEQFRVCNYCKRIVCNERSIIDGHTCVIEVKE